jgi:carbonic anhydrase
MCDEIMISNSYLGYEWHVKNILCKVRRKILYQGHSSCGTLAAQISQVSKTNKFHCKTKYMQEIDLLVRNNLRKLTINYAEEQIILEFN